MDIELLKDLSFNIRKSALKMTSRGGSSHIASILSLADILAVLYGAFLKKFPDIPSSPNRDRFILSKGHAGAGIYATLAEVGFFSKKMLETHYQNGSLLSGHVSHKGIPGVEFSTGSLGHGLPVGVGLALSGKRTRSSHKVVVLMGDGECDEGSNWEAILVAAHHKLDNLIAIIDANQFQSIKKTSETLNLEPFAEKWRAFGWAVADIDGHNFHDIYDALNKKYPGSPLCIIARTIKGKGVSFMEGNILWHYRSAQGNEFDLALKELELTK
jgi:transketolase